MKLLTFEGYMIPGLNFKDQCIWILNWSDNPTPFKKMIEIWILGYDGQKVCYLSPYEGKSVFQKYHSFDEVIQADITISEAKEGISICVKSEDNEILALSLKFKKSLKYSFINFLIKHGNKDKVGEKGKTETGMFYHNMPKRITPIRVEKAELNGTSLHLIHKVPIKLSLGDGKPSDEPIINYCTHMLEK